MTTPLKFLLINPRVSDTDKNVFGYRVFPLGLGILAAILEENGITVTVFDIRLESLEREQVRTRLRSLLPEHDVVGISAIVNCLSYVEWLSEEIKTIKPSATILLGGSICTSVLPLLANTTACDIFCIGEGEQTILELVAHIREGLALEQIKGIAFRNEQNELVTTPARERLKELDSTPLPAYHLFDTQAYADLPSRIPNVGKHMTIIAGRGCPFSCTYCLPAFGRKVVLRLPQRLIEEIAFLVLRRLMWN